MHHHSVSRRNVLRSLGGLCATLAATSYPLRAAGPSSLGDPEDRKLLFILCATGGASIVDSFLPVELGEVPNSASPQTLNAYPAELLVQPDGSNIRCVRPLPDTDFLTAEYSIEAFLREHYQELTVVCHDVTSVNHTVAQKRALTGAGINRGRTLAEAAAERHGVGLPLANCNMAVGGYVEPGDDRSLMAHAKGEIIASPLRYALSTHGSRGIRSSLAPAQVDRARRIRERLEVASPFGTTYRDARGRLEYLRMRSEVSSQLEKMDAITKLMLLDPSGMAEFGLSRSPLQQDLNKVFPGVMHDQWQQQGALAFMLAYYGLSCANTMSLNFNPAFDGDALVGAPLAFDFSHNFHRGAQNVMWGRVLRVADGLINLLKRFDYLGDPALGKMWDRSLIYVATDFGRDKTRPPDEWNYGTGHHLNNGSVLLSPLLQGNRVFGGVDPSTLLTHGFNLRTGESDPGTVLREPEVYSLVAQALDIDFPGRRDLSAVLA